MMGMGSYAFIHKNTGELEGPPARKRTVVPSNLLEATANIVN